MDKKQTIKKTAALLLGLTLAMSATGCGFITTDNQKDLDQVVAKVDITSVMEKEDKALADELSAFKLSGEVKKRELVSYYLSIGYQYVNNYGYSYEDAFNLLLNALINKETLAQEAFAYFLKKNNLNAAAFETYRQEELKNLGKNEQEILGKDGKYAEILALKYVLTNNNTEMDDYNVAEYTLKKNLNNSIDSLEKSLITVDEEEHDHGEARTLPTNVGTEVEDYYVTGYEVYTGRNGADACEGYERLEGSTVATRQKAYNAFLSNLQEYNLVNASGKEDTSKITSLEYYYVELASLLEQRLINKYYEAREEAITAELDANDGKYVQDKYTEMYNIDAKKYDGNPTSFAGAMDSVSADSFLLYAPLDQNEEGKDMTFGYVYNILIPFSTSQTVAYTEAKNQGLAENELYAARREIGAQVKGKDLRSSWISKHDHANYSYEQEGQYFFFEENLKGDTHEKLTQYAGTYAFNGTVVDNGGDDYEVKATDVSIDQFMTIFENHINDTVGKEVAKGGVVSAYETDN
ncbi:MAG: hypothetical protein IJW96_03300, partial [Clostridia bacterium]|nr:hypothetical protein [Clostridia bacterium]